MYKVDSPKIMFAHTDSTFLNTMPNNTHVSALDSYLINAEASKTFTMVFQFDKQMERESVENRINWQIGRSTQNGIGQASNFGLRIPSTEVSVSIIDHQRTVRFPTSNGRVSIHHLQLKLRLFETCH